jgi:DNA-binding phage protein
MPNRRFPPPVTAEEHNDACFIAEDHAASTATPTMSLCANRSKGAICSRATSNATVLRAKDVVRLLRQEVAEAGGQSAWAKRTGIHRTLVNKILLEQKPLTKSIIKVLQLEVVYLQRSVRRQKNSRGNGSRVNV